MTSDDFASWLAVMGFSGREAARRLGVADNTVLGYRSKGTPLYIALACAALAQDIQPWKHGDNDA